MATSQQDIKQQLIADLRAHLENRKKGVRDNPSMIDNLCDYLFLNNNKENVVAKKLMQWGQYNLEDKEKAINKIISEIQSSDVNGAVDFNYTETDINAAMDGETGKILQNPLYANILPPRFKAALKKVEMQKNEYDRADARMWVACNRK